MRPRFRHERFGAILALDEPPMLAHVDKEFARSVGVPESPLWDEEAQAALTAPTEAHMTVTRRCPLSCSHCYTSSHPTAGQDLSTEEVKKRIDALAESKVFHLAMGGGEAFLRPDLLDLARYARERGITPNLTTSGAIMDPRLARECAEVFGQINLSVDALANRELFGEDKTSLAERALPILLSAGVRVGFNIVVSRDSFAELPRIVAFAAAQGCCDVEWLRFKPAGRGRDEYLRHRMSPEQRLALFPLALELSEKHQIPVKLDCSSAPFVACHSVPVERMEAFDVLGCIGGLSLLGVDETGASSACSFYPHEEVDVLELAEHWSAADSYPEFRQYPERAQEPCRSCDYLSLCRGGCRAVARFLTDDVWAPDPECPKVATFGGGEV